MANVNHKRVRQLMNEKRSRINDRQFFSSRILAGHFEDMAAAQTKRYRYNRRVRVLLSWSPKSGTVAQTDNQTIEINAGNPFVTAVRGRENRYQIVCGLFAHELGHILYTDFPVGQTHLNAFAAGHWFPCCPELKTPKDVRCEKELWEYLGQEESKKQAFLHLVHRISNVLEDGYIENRMMNEFPGTFAYGLQKLRALHFASIPTVTDCIEQETDGQALRFDTIMQLLLSYAKFGEIKYGETPLYDVRIRTVFRLLNEIDSALMTLSGKDRLVAVNEIILTCWDDIRDWCDVYAERIKQAQAAECEATVADILKAVGGCLGGESEEAHGTTAPVGNTSGGAPLRLPNRAEREKTEADANADEMPVSTEGEDDTKGTSAEPEVDGRLPHLQTASVSEPEGGETEYNPDYTCEANERAAHEVEQLLDTMAEKQATEELENERLRELNDAAQSISYGNVHAGVSVRVNRMSEVGDVLKEQYNQIAPPLLEISRQLGRHLIRQLKERKPEEKQTGLLFGRRLNPHALYRDDGRVFTKNNLPGGTPKLAVGLLLDESGSMNCSNRNVYARASAIILYDFCRSMDIPIMVYGHSTESGRVELYSYAEFESFDSDDKYRLMDVKAREGNRDGAALRFVAEQLVKRPEEIRMLILVSDGQPADYGYVGTAAEEDLRGIRQEYQRKGIVFVAAAIGDDKVSIERIYGDSFLDITDLRQLPMKLTGVVGKHIPK